MSEVVDRPGVVNPTQAERAETKPPQRYNVQAWTAGHHCSAKFIIVVGEVFKINSAVAGRLSEHLRSNPRVAVALNLTNDVAEMQAARANQKLKEMVGDCQCGHKIEFVPVPQ